MLREGEIIQLGDEYYIRDWIKIREISRYLGREWGCNLAPFRRRTKYSIEQGEKAIGLLNKLTKMFLDEKVKQDNLSYKLFDIMIKWNKNKFKKCKILNGRYKNEIGVILTDNRQLKDGKFYYKIRTSNSAVNFFNSEEYVEII